MNNKEIDLNNLEYLMSFNKKNEECSIFQKQNFIEEKNIIYFSLRNYISNEKDEVNEK